MADKKITALTDLSTGIAGADLLHVVDDPTGTPINKKVSVTDFINNLPSFIGFSNSVQDVAASATAAISITTALTLLQTTDTTATTLANGTVQGQIKIIVHDADQGSSVCTPQTRLGYADLNFVDDGDTAMLMWTGAAWAIIGFADVGADIPADIIDIAN
jgi:hypothetical protein|tara:strand:- start:414 stop:893 length:480 start_codon:yes stop_codon:yes gene_type:complete